jgi:uncharacterized membrane protein
MILRAAFVGLLALYPFLVYFGIRVLPASYFGLLLAALVLLRFSVVNRDERAMALPLMLLLLAYAIVAAIIGRTQALLYYPVLVNGLLCVVFALSLRKGEPLLLRLVRARGMAMSEHATGYLTRLTGIWAGFFAANGLVALWTTTASLEVWTLYNGLISYLLVATLMLGEWLFRRHYKRRLGISDH